MKCLMLVPFHERGYKMLAELLKNTSSTFHLPIPRELCRNPLERWQIPSGLWGYVRVWWPVLDALSLRENNACYLTLDRLKESTDLSVKLIGLVIKARVYGRIDLTEWFSVLPSRIELSAPSSWRDVLVVDRFTEYFLLSRGSINYDYLVEIERLIPTPLDLLLLVKSGLLNWSCDVSDLVKFAIKYLGDYVLTSRDLTEVYDKLKGSKEYWNLICECIRESDLAC